MKIVRRHGRLRLRLEPAERELLSMMFDELQALFDSPQNADDAVLQRLFPAAYQDDAEAETEYRALTEESLRSLRDERLDACRADLAAEDDIDLADEAATRWIQVLNDLRLALGTRLGVTEDDDHDIDPTDPEMQQRVVYYWLTAVQDSVVSGLSR